MSHDDIFCGECGFVSRAITQAFNGTIFTAATRRIDLGADRAQPAAVAPEPKPAPEQAPARGRANWWAEVVAAQPEPVIDVEARMPARPSQARQFQAQPSQAPAAPAAEVPAVPDAAAAHDDIEATRIVRRASGDRFVLQFSTGESFTVHGTGLVGRNPKPEPGEYFDQLVRVLDTGKSVSKTHLEFGQEAGAFWVNDRFSGNGTVLREPETSARRAEAGRRYRIVRGTRVDIGEQFFVVS